MDGLGRILGFEVEELGDNNVGSVVGDGAVDADDSLLEEAREDVVAPLSPGRVLYHNWDQTVRPRQPGPWGRRGRRPPDSAQVVVAQCGSQVLARSR